MKITTKMSLSAVAVICIMLLSFTGFAQATKHTVKPGETFYHIAKEYGVSVGQLQKANPAVGAGYAIKVGQELTIPAGGTATTTKEPIITEAPVAKTATEKPAAAKAEKPAETKPVATPGKTEVTAEGVVEPLPTRGYHIVGPKETTATIARDFGITLTQLKEWNDLSGGLKPGMKLKVVDLDSGK